MAVAMEQGNYRGRCLLHCMSPFMAQVRPPGRLRSGPLSGVQPPVRSMGSQPAYRPRSCQFDRTSAPTVPHFVQTMRGPKRGHRSIAGHMIDIEDHPMPALIA
jgi:hypothetical protein